MKQEHLRKMSIDELQLKEKTLKAVLILFVGILILLIGVIIYMLVKNGLTPMTMIAVPSALLPVLLYSLKNLKDLRNEIKSRQ